MKSIENHLKVHAEALNLRSQRNEILASNIANSATPNFKAKDLDFEALLNSRMGFGKVNTSNSKQNNRITNNFTNVEGESMIFNFTDSPIEFSDVR